MCLKCDFRASNGVCFLEPILNMYIIRQHTHIPETLNRKYYLSSIILEFYALLNWIDKILIKKDTVFNANTRRCDIKPFFLLEVHNNISIFIFIKSPGDFHTWLQNSTPYVYISIWGGWMNVIIRWKLINDIYSFVFNAVERWNDYGI